jgi:hypothetical protein
VTGLEPRTLLSDMTPPTTTASVSGTAGSNGFYVSLVTVNLTATDQDDPPSSLTTEYSLNNGASFTQGNTVSLTGDGTFNVEYFSTDPAGNVEATHTLVVRVDQTPPVTTVTANPNSLWPPNGKFVNVHVTGRVTDTDLGPNPTVSYHVVDEYGQVQPSGSNIPVNPDGTYSFNVPLQSRREGQDKDGRTYTIDVVAHDLAGNTGTGSTTVIVPHDQGHGGNGGQPDQDFVNAVFEDLFDRDASTSEQDTFAQWLQKGASPQTLVSALQNTPEHEADEINRLFQTYLNRNADPNAIAVFSPWLQKGASPHDIARVLLDSPAFSAKHASNSDFIAAAYFDVLGRAPDPSGFAFFLGQLNQGASRDSVVTALLFSTEKDADDVNTMFIDVLGRPADAGGEQFFIGLLKSGQGSDDTVELSLLTSQEFLNEFFAGGSGNQGGNDQGNGDNGD